MFLLLVVKDVKGADHRQTMRQAHSGPNHSATMRSVILRLRLDDCVKTMVQGMVIDARRGMVGAMGSPSLPEKEHGRCGRRSTSFLSFQRLEHGQA